MGRMFFSLIGTSSAMCLHSEKYTKAGAPDLQRVAAVSPAHLHLHTLTAVHLRLHTAHIRRSTPLPPHTHISAHLHHTCTSTLSLFHTHCHSSTSALSLSRSLSFSLSFSYYLNSKFFAASYSMSIVENSSASTTAVWLFSSYRSCLTITLFALGPTVV